MVMKRTKQPWMKAETFGRSLPGGIGINLLVPEIEPMEGFLRSVLSGRTIYADEDFAAIELGGALMMLHADHSYADHEMAGVVDGAELRGLGVEIRVYGLDPDQAEQAARRLGHVVLAGAVDKPHGLRECHLVGPAGYVFVPSLASAAG
ncbi:MAG: hypothetical protein ABWZ57_02040 [Mesorhizobium sp.]|jgi:hypothetical protein